MVKEILKGKEFLATLTADEMLWVVDSLATNAWNSHVVDRVLGNKMDFAEGEHELFIDQWKKDFSKKGNKHLLGILEDEFRGVEIKIGINIAGKQKDLSGLSDKILSVFQFALTNPIPPHLVKPFNDILEYGGISPADFSSVSSMTQMPQNQQMQPSPVQPKSLQLNQPIA